MMISQKKILKTAIKAAKTAGKIHRQYFLKKTTTIKTKSTSFDLVTTADIEAEKAIKKIIKKQFPNHSFLGEESGSEIKDSPYTWIVDPLDGTNNFASGLPIFCASVALAKEKQTIAAAIYDVTRNELFYASKGGGAFLNGQPIKVADIDSLQNSLLITGFYYSRGKEMLETLDNIKHFFQHGIRGIRRLGSAALDLCYVAAGRTGGFWEFELKPWDFAAGKLIVEEAGGEVTNQQGKNVSVLKKQFIVASNKTLHPAMLKILKK